MKRCPKCNADYSDESLNFCLNDGEWLHETTDQNEPATAILHETDASGNAPTKVQIHTTTGVEATKGVRFGILSVDKRLLAVAALLSVIALVGFAYRYLNSAANGRMNSIAVLPFENRSGSSDADYLSDGIADSLIYRLTQLPDLKVSPTSSVMRYKGKETEVGEIAKELDVDAVMSGRLVQRGDDLSVSVQLTDARTNKLIWAEQYDRKMSDLLAIQREIATALADKLQLKLYGEDAKGITKKYTNSNEAYRLYMLGRHYFAKRTRADMLRSIEHYRQAIELDPNFALAYARTAEVYGNLPAYSYVSPTEAAPPGKAAAQKALEVDPTLSEAHAFSGFLLAEYDWNWDQAEREFKKALELDPNSASAHLRYAQLFLWPKGRLDEAQTQLKTAHDLEPLDIVTGGLHALTYVYSRQNDKALDVAMSTYDLEPKHPFARWVLATVLTLNGRFGESIGICEETLRSDPTDQYMLHQCGLAYARSGQISKADKVIATFGEIEKGRYVGNYNVATVLAAIGRRDEAFRELENAYKTRDFFLSRLTVDPFMDPLRDDSRFKDLVKRLGLAQD